jgi:UDP-2-acetamido-2,6-beta-L-arabino-hexul-4-ose reductase
MKIAITGEGGFLGYHLTQYYKQKVEVVSLGRNFAENLERARDCDFIVHAAGVNRAATDKEVYDGNIELAMVLVNRLKQLDMKINIKFISSVQEGNETSYGTSKLAAKHIIQEYCDEVGVQFESYTLPNLYGTHGKPNYNSFVNTFAYNIINELECNYNNNEVNLCWVYDAIKVIDNQTTDYNLQKTRVSEVYFLLKGLNELTIEVMGNFSGNLFKILNYYKNENINIRP